MAQLVPPPSEIEREMDPEIWHKLPSELLEHVLYFLPLKNVLKLRSTCKEFRSLIFSPSFISRHSSLIPARFPFSTFLLLSHPQLYNKFRLYDASIGCWKDLSLSLVRFSSGGSPSSSSNLLSSANGLLCFCLPSSCFFVVWNALTKSSRVIEFPSFPFSFESFSFFSSSSSYHILVLCSKFTCNSNSIFLYDSKSHSWTEFKGIHVKLYISLLQSAVFFKGAFYFPTLEPFSIVSFNQEKGTWDQTASDLPGQLTFVRLVSDGDSNMHLVGGIGNNGISRIIKVWELEEDGMRWTEVDKLPETMCRKFLSICYHNYDHVYCFRHHGMICLCCYNWPEILYFDVSRRSWHWIPRCPSLPEKWSCGFKWFSFTPQVYPLV